MPSNEARLDTPHGPLVVTFTGATAAYVTNHDSGRCQEPFTRYRVAYTVSAHFELLDGAWRPHNGTLQSVYLRRADHSFTEPSLKARQRAAELVAALVARVAAQQPLLPLYGALEDARSRHRRAAQQVADAEARLATAQDTLAQVARDLDSARQALTAAGVGPDQGCGPVSAELNMSA